MGAECLGPWNGPSSCTRTPISASAALSPLAPTATGKQERRTDPSQPKKHALSPDRISRGSGTLSAADDCLASFRSPATEGWPRSGSRGPSKSNKHAEEDDYGCF